VQNFSVHILCRGSNAFLWHWAAVWSAQFCRRSSSECTSMQNCSTHVESMPSAWALDAVWRQWAALWSVQFRRKFSSEQAFHADLLSAYGEYTLCLGFGCSLATMGSRVDCTDLQEIQLRVCFPCRTVRRMWRVCRLPGLWMPFGGSGQLCGLYSFAENPVQNRHFLQNCSARVESMPSARGPVAVWWLGATA
jgi:hypothetical protein